MEKNLDEKDLKAKNRKKYITSYDEKDIDNFLRCFNQEFDNNNNKKEIKF